MIAMIKKFILFLLRIFRRALCCFSRKRCDSNSQHDSRLEAVSVVNDSPNFKKSNAVTFTFLLYYSWMKISWIFLQDGERLELLGRQAANHRGAYRSVSRESCEDQRAGARRRSWKYWFVCDLREWKVLGESNGFDCQFSWALGYGTENSQTEESLPQPGRQRAAEFLATRGDSVCRDPHNSELTVSNWMSLIEVFLEWTWRLERGPAGRLGRDKRAKH